MKKRGFTLVELIAVIVVLAVVMVIAVPIITDSINKSQEKAYNNQISGLINAAKKWGASNTGKLPDENGLTVSLPTGKQIANKSQFSEILGLDYIWLYGNYWTSSTVDDSLVYIVDSGGDFYPNDVTYTYGVRPVITIPKLSSLCKAKSIVTNGNLAYGNYNYGDEYSCTLNDGIENTFYVVENNDDTVSLLLDRNYDEELLTWCKSGSSNSCNADGLSAKINEIKEKWIGNVNNEIVLNFSTLFEEGYIKQKEIINPKTDKELEGCIKISYDNEYLQYKYEYTVDKTFCNR